MNLLTTRTAVRSGAACIVAGAIMAVGALSAEASPNTMSVASTSIASQSKSIAPTPVCNGIYQRFSMGSWSYSMTNWVSQYPARRWTYTLRVWALVGDAEVFPGQVCSY